MRGRNQGAKRHALADVTRYRPIVPEAIPSSLRPGSLRNPVEPCTVARGRDAGGGSFFYRHVRRQVSAGPASAARTDTARRGHYQIVLRMRLRGIFDELMRPPVAADVGGGSLTAPEPRKSPPTAGIQPQGKALNHRPLRGGAMNPQENLLFPGSDGGSRRSGHAGCGPRATAATGTVTGRRARFLDRRGR